MRKALLIVGFLLGLSAPAWAQTPCIGVGGVNSVPQVGVSCLQEPAVSAFAAAGFGIVPASAATDIACITGAANVVVRVQTIRVSGTAGTGLIVPVVITKHTVANTGGSAATTTALPVPVKLDSTLNAALATTTAYTGNPTVDASAVTLDVADLALTKTDGTNGFAQPYTLFNWADALTLTKPTIRGVAQQVCVNINGTSPSSGLMNVTFDWTESPQ